MASKMPHRLVALSFAAIATVYSAGYYTTQAADSRLALSEAGPVAALTVPATATLVPAPATAVPAPVASRQQPTPTPTAPATARAAPAAPVATAAYKDGTYEGSGTSRRGGFRVAVTIQGGAITNVALTQVTTQYPALRIAALPGQVIVRQSAQVDRVSGATYSTQAFQQAVQQALNAASAGQGA
jgi:uncharacterized protein with FMN-binding domain